MRFSVPEADPPIVDYDLGDIVAGTEIEIAFANAVAVVTPAMTARLALLLDEADRMGWEHINTRLTFGPDTDARGRWIVSMQQ